MENYEVANYCPFCGNSAIYIDVTLAHHCENCGSVFLVQYAY